MASINSLTKLFTAIASNDSSRAQAIAGEIVSTEEKKGHHAAAKALRGALRPNEPRYAQTPVNESGRMMSDALSRVQPSVGLEAVVLRKNLRIELDHIVREWQLREKLNERGIERRRRLFFYGPPGCGKSLSAMALGRDLGLPVYVVRFDAVIGAYLGQTALHLRELFRFAESAPCILLIDEVDALAKKRGNPRDVGELDRIVIAMMQELEHTHPAGLVIATSNLPEHIDEALWRRFDLVLEFAKPSEKELGKYAATLAAELRHKLSAAAIKKVRRAKSYAEAEKLIESEIRRSIIEEFDS